MANNFIVTVASGEETQVVVQQQGVNTATTDIYNPITIPRLGDVGDVDTATLINGSVLVYKTNTSRWTATTTLDEQNMEGGEF